MSFIEQNCALPNLGNGAADASAGSLSSLFNFQQPNAGKLYLDPVAGEPKRNSS